MQWRSRDVGHRVAVRAARARRPPSVRRRRMTEHDQMLEYYAAPGPMTDLTGVPADVFDGLPTDPVGLCRAVPGLVVHEVWAGAYGFEVPEDRLTDPQSRSAAEMTDAIQRLAPGPLSAAP